jgi:TolB-like protein
LYTPRTLATDVTRHRRLPPAECVRIGLALTSALAHLHRHKLVHRDVKPSNIIFVGGVPKLADIGLVAEVSEARSYVGTEGFIPPEGPGTVQADLYSLGKLLYEISTGKDRHAFPELPSDLAERLSNRFSASTLQRFNASSPAAPFEVNSIAVLPFVNESKYAPHEYLSDALTDETMNALTHCAGLRVAPRSAVVAFKRTTNDLQQIGEQLGVRMVQVGTFLRTSNGMHLTASFLTVADGKRGWSTNFDRKREEFDSLGNDLIASTAQALGFTLPDSVLDHARTNLTRKLAAYKLYSQAITNWRNTQDALDRGIRLLNQAITEDPNHALAYAHLAQRYAEAADFYLPQAQAMTAAKMNALRAVQLDDSLPLAHSALAFVYSHHELNLDQAKAHFQRAIELAPNNGETYGNYATELFFFGQFKDADDVLQRGDQVDPNDHNLLGGWWWRHYLDRDFEKARQAAIRLRAVWPGSIIGPYYLALAHEGLRQYDQALALEQRVVERDPTLIDIAFLARRIPAYYSVAKGLPVLGRPARRSTLSGVAQKSRPGEVSGGESG